MKVFENVFSMERITFYIPHSLGKHTNDDAIYLSKAIHVNTSSANCTLYQNIFFHFGSVHIDNHWLYIVYAT